MNATAGMVDGGDRAPAAEKISCGLSDATRVRLLSHCRQLSLD